MNIREAKSLSELGTTMDVEPLSNHPDVVTRVNGVYDVNTLSGVILCQRPNPEFVVIPAGPDPSHSEFFHPNTSNQSWPYTSLFRVENDRLKWLQGSSYSTKSEALSFFEWPNITSSDGYAKTKYPGVVYTDIPAEETSSSSELDPLASSGIMPVVTSRPNFNLPMRVLSGWIIGPGLVLAGVFYLTSVHDRITDFDIDRFPRYRAIQEFGEEVADRVVNIITSGKNSAAASSTTSVATSGVSATSIAGN